MNIQLELQYLDASSENMVDFYKISDNGAFSKVIYNVVGENAIWSYDANTKKLSISGNGELYVDSSKKERFPLSSTSYFSGSALDGAWRALTMNGALLMKELQVYQIMDLQFFLVLIQFCCQKL